MIMLFLILLILLSIGICALLILVNELEKKINSIQYQIDDALCNINIVNGNVLNTYGILNEMKQKQNEHRL